MCTEAKAKSNGFKIRKVVPATEEEARTILERMDAEVMDKWQDILDIYINIFYIRTPLNKQGSAVSYVPERITIGAGDWLGFFLPYSYMHPLY